MPGPEATSDHTPDTTGRWMCSHLVRLVFLGEPQLSETALLEEIDADRALLAVNTAYPADSVVTITADSLELRSRVAECRARENDFYLDLRFDEDIRWSPELWRPDHLYLPGSVSPKKRKAAGAGG